MASEHLKTYLDELSEKIEYITTNLTADTGVHGHLGHLLIPRDEGRVLG